ncbi:MAG: aminodeoxychorismate/anthranilate synthase component II [Bacteroidales bacterium]
MNILLLDNYDSFTYNIVHAIRKLGFENITVKKNDEITLDEVAAFDKIILSPGPGLPHEAGIMLDLIRRYAPEKSILGICLGHQAIAEAFGGSLLNLNEVFHGVSSEVVRIADDPVFETLPAEFNVGRYHSWIVQSDSLPSCINVTMTTKDGMVMAIAHRIYDVHGLQFHPESILTPCGERILLNFLQYKSKNS